MDDLKVRVVGAINEVLNKYFDAPERNWSAHTHEAIAGVKADLVFRVEAEFDRKDEVEAVSAIAVPDAGAVED